jgi:transcriptional regulator with XRE-family HTH domain
MLRLKTDKELLERIGLAVRAERARHGWRQEDLASRSGVAHRTVTRVEAGLPTQTDTLIRLMRVLQMLDRLEAVVEPSLTPAPSPLEGEDDDDAPEIPQRVRLPGPK